MGETDAMTPEAPQRRGRGSLPRPSSGPLGIAAVHAGDRLVRTNMPGMKKFCSTWSV